MYCVAVGVGCHNAVYAQKHNYFAPNWQKLSHFSDSQQLGFCFSRLKIDFNLLNFSTSVLEDGIIFIDSLGHGMWITSRHFSFYLQICLVGHDFWVVAMMMMASE